MGFVVLGTNYSASDRSKPPKAFVKFFFMCDPADLNSTFDGCEDARKKVPYLNTGVYNTFETGHTDAVVEIAFGPHPATKTGSQMIATGGKDFRVKVWLFKITTAGIVDFHLAFNMEDALYRVYTIAWRPDGRHIAVGSDDTCIRVYDIGTQLDKLQDIRVDNERNEETGSYFNRSQTSLSATMLNREPQTLKPRDVIRFHCDYVRAVEYVS